MTDAMQPDAQGHRYLARFGTFILATDRSGDVEELHSRIGDAVRADNRVVNVVVPNINPHWISTNLFHPGSVRDPEVLLQGSDGMRGVQYPRPYVFELSVPTKNQPAVYGRSPAADHYYVAWDGCIAVVLWDASGALDAPSAAGQVLIEVLESAADALGLRLYVQACSPGCELKFAHRSMLVEAVASELPGAEFEADDTDVVKVRLAITDEYPAAAVLHRHVEQVAGEFAQLKSVARRVLDMEHAAQLMTAELLSLDYVAMARGREPLRRRIAGFLHDLRHHRRERGARRLRYLIASLWLAMARIEVLQQRYSDLHRRYEDRLTRWAIPQLFDLDLKADEAGVGQIDAQFARAAVENRSLRIDTRVMVISTIVAGLAGGAIGLVGAILAMAVGGAA